VGVALLQAVDAANSPWKWSIPTVVAGFAGKEGNSFPFPPARVVWRQYLNVIVSFFGEVRVP